MSAAAGGRRVVLGTAGHIDHGKSTLVQALTGEDPDRLAEEKRRGITIELGFAQLELPDGSAPPPARATSGTTSMRAQPAGTALRSASARRSARTRTASSGSESMRSVGMEASARSGSRYRRSVASSAASVILSRRSARASGCFFRRSI